MSLKITMTCICDGCKKELAMAEPGTTGIDSARWAIQRHLTKIGGMERQLFRRKTKHYCKNCADTA